MASVHPLPRPAVAAVPPGVPSPPDREAPSDESLIEQFLRGDVQAFTTLVIRHRTRVFRIARKMGFDREDARGIAQAVFLHIYSRLGRFRGEAKFSTWLYTVTRNRCLNYARKLSRERQAITQNESLPGCLQSPEDILIRKESEQTVHRALANLDAKYGRPLVLHYLEDQSYEQIAETLAIPLRTVETRLYRGRQLFKSFFLDRV